MEEEKRIPGEFEAVVVRMPVRIYHHAFVNMHIANVVYRGAKALDESERLWAGSKKHARAISKVEACIKIINKYEPVSVVDRVMSHLARRSVTKSLVAKLGRFLITDDKSDECKKTGIAFLGTFGAGKDISAISELAINEEYTFFAIKALKQLMGEGEDFIKKATDIASKTYGWGKIAAILELPDKIQDKDVKAFLLEGGTANYIGKYLLAVECAIKGRLYDYLERTVSENLSIGPDMASGICDIFQGLIEAESIKDADSFTEIDGILKIISNFCTLYENNRIDCKEAADIYENLKKRL